MPSIHVRPMTLEDVPAIAQWLATIPLFQRYRLTPEKARAQLQQAIHRGDWMVAADMGDADHGCGFAWGLVGGAFGRSLYLRLIGVRPDCAGSGIGSALLAEAEKAALENGSDLFLLVSDFNADAQRFYRRHGYEQIGAIPGYVLPDVSELIFWKRLRRYT